MRDVALFLNGVYEDVLKGILAVQAHLPEHIMYLQPYSGERIVRLAENTPTVDDPVRLFVSVTDDLTTVRYVGEIVGWDDKRKLKGAKRRILNRLIYLLQPTEDGVYRRGRAGGPECVNLLYIRRLHKLSMPFSVDQLINANTGEPLSTGRTQSGGWVYIVNPDETWLKGHL